MIKSVFVRNRKSRRSMKCLARLAAFTGGFLLGHVYYLYLLKKIPFPNNLGHILSLTICLLLGVGNVVCMQLRCISLLVIPMYCGVPGRGLLKVVVLTYVIAGPITNMGLNAKEVVRVFACSTQLTDNLTKARRKLMDEPFKHALISMRPEISQIKDTLKSINEVIKPIESEIESFRSEQILRSHRSDVNTTSVISRKEEYKDFYQTQYIEKLNDRCKQQLFHAIAYCPDVSAYIQSQRTIPIGPSWAQCKAYNLSHLCNIDSVMEYTDICNSRNQINPGLGEGYVTLKRAKEPLTHTRDVSMQYHVNLVRELYDVQDAKETGDRVIHAFEEKFLVMRAVSIAVDVGVALLFLRLFSEAITYHDQYLTNIEHDNVFITGTFEKIDRKRRRRGLCNILPLKRMEKSKYVDMKSMSYSTSERNTLVMHVLKLSLEVVTATTFVMLDRLFYEALDVVCQHAETQLPSVGTRHLEIEVEGTGTIANMVRKVLESVNIPGPRKQSATSRKCLPRPRLIPFSYYLKIYGGYLWILFLLYINPYTMRLKRLMCSYFYPCREKQRILHLYNDILKKRMKMHKTLRKNAVQAVRAHYLSGENLLSLRMKFPRLLGWLRVLPAARMTCLICGETEPRNGLRENGESVEWHRCGVTQCPFVYCAECWQEAGARCPACRPAIHHRTDYDSLSDDDLTY